MHALAMRHELLGKIQSDKQGYFLALSAFFQESRVRWAFRNETSR